MILSIHVLKISYFNVTKATKAVKIGLMTLTLELNVVQRYHTCQNYVFTADTCVEDPGESIAKQH